MTSGQVAGKSPSSLGEAASLCPHTVMMLLVNFIPLPLLTQMLLDRNLACYIVPWPPGQYGTAYLVSWDEEKCGEESLAPSERLSEMN